MRLALANERVQCDTAGQPVLMLKTLRRDGNVHLLMSTPAIMRLRVGLALCGNGIHWRYVNSGSMAGLRGRELGAVDLPFKLDDHEADVGVYLVPAISRCS